MSFTKKSYEDIRDNILDQITKGEMTEKHIYMPQSSRYELRFRPVKAITSVRGLLEDTVETFNEKTDYNLKDGVMEWTDGGRKPDERSPFYISYAMGTPITVTDVTPGSVVRTIVEAVSREIDYLYSQMNYVYLAGFIDTSTGSALDLVVSILGVDRKPAEPASGFVTFGRNTDPEEISVESEAHIFDGRDIYPLKNSPVKEVNEIEGEAAGKSYTFEVDGDYSVDGDQIQWLEAGTKPDLNSTFYVSYTTYEKISVPAGVQVSTYGRRAEDTITYETAKEGVLVKTTHGRWEADVPVKATIPGVEGNVHAGALVVMPKPLVGVEYIINRRDILNGTSVEPDADLRERGRHALEVAGKATLVSLDSAIKGVEGVNTVLIEDMPDGVSGVVKVIAQGGDDTAIKRVIEETRAAGIKVEFARPMIVRIDISLTVELSRGADASKAAREVEAEIRGYLSSLDIGDDVIYNRIVNSSIKVTGVYDVTEINIRAFRDGTETVTSTGENIEISPVEIGIARDVNVSVRILER